MSQDPTTSLVTDAAIAEARERIAPHVLRTPLLESPALSDTLGATMHLKAELFQHTGSFKARGVFNKALSLSREELDRGLIAFSAGNHAMAVAHVGVTLGVPVTVCMPSGAVQFKIDAVRALGANLDLVDGDLVGRAMALRDELGATLIHPFDDPAIVAGHASLGCEVVEDLPEITTALIPVGGGGLISGTAVALKRANPDIRIVGIEPDTADVVSRSRAAGEPVVHPGPASLADGLGAPITGQINLDHIEAFVDELVVIPEDTIRPAWRELLTLTKLAGEPAAAVSIAAVRCGALTLDADEVVAMVICGGNADFDKLAG